MALGLLPSGRRERTARGVERMRDAVGGYLAGAIVQAAVGGAVTTTLCLLLGNPYYLALGLGYFVLGFIPYAGSALMAVLISLATLASVGLNRALLALALFLIYQQVEGNLLQPLIQRRSIRMNPLLITVVVLVGTGAWGLVGALVSLPVAAAIQVGLREVQRERTRAVRPEAPADGGPTDVRGAPEGLGPRAPDGTSAPPSLRH